MLLEAYDRNLQRTTELTAAQIASGRRSLNLVLYSWANRGINLWTVAQFIQYMAQGTTQYIAPPQIVDILADSVILRQYLMGGPVSVAPQFTTTLGSPNVAIAGFSATPSAGQFISVGVQVSVGGLILSGFYQVTSVPASGQATVTAASNATASVVSGGVVPSIASTANSTTMTVTFPNHGLLVGQPFNVQVTSSVGGVTLLGPYPVASVLSANSFTFTAPYPAGSAQTVGENGGNASLSTQSVNPQQVQASFPEDIQLFPMSRTEYMSIPNKTTQGRTTSFWIDRQINPVMNFWPVFDQNGPYEIVFRASQYVQTADITGGQVLNCPARFLESFASDLAAHLSMKWNPERSADLRAYAAEQWQLAAGEDIEKVSLYLQPSFSGYFS